MFDLGFSELMVIALVALIVIGPERLPRVARTLGHLAGRLQRYVADVKADISREAEFDELRKTKDEVQRAASEFESSMNEDLRKAETDLNRSVAEAAGESEPAVPAPAAAETPALTDTPADAAPREVGGVSR